MVRSSSAPTSLDVARLAGVSQPTVSRVMSGHKSVSPAVRKKVLEAVKACGYRSNALARSLRSGRTQTVGMVWSSVPYGLDYSVAHMFAARLEAHGYVLFPVEAPGGRAVLGKTLAGLAERRVDALVLYVHPGLHDFTLNLKELELFPTVVLVSSRALSGQPQSVDVIHQDRHAAMVQVAEHLARSGRRRVGMVTGDVHSNQVKITGLKTGLGNHGISLPDSQVFHLEMAFGLEHVVGEVWQLLDHHRGDVRQLDALVCSNDTLAAAVCKWLGRQGIRVPDDVAVVGFDNNDWCQCLTPELASVDRHDRELVDLLENMVMRRLNQPRLPIMRKVLPMTFVWRESAGGDGVTI